MSRLLALFVLAASFVTAADKPATPAKPAAALRPARMVWFPRYSPDGSKVATAHGNWDQQATGEVRIWEAATGKPVQTLPTERGVRSVAWSPDGRSVAAGTYGQALYIFDVDSGRQTQKLKLPANVEVVLITPDGDHMLTALGNGYVTLSEFPSGKQVYAWNAIHEGGIWGMAQSKDGKLLATAGQDDFVHVISLESRKVLHDLKHPADANGLCFFKDGQKLLTGCGDSLIRVFDVATGEQTAQFEGHTGGAVTDLQLSSDDKALVSAGMDNTVRVWDVSDLKSAAVKKTFDGFDNFVFGVSIAPHDKSIAAASWDDQIKTWDFATLKEQWAWKWKK